MLKRGLMPSLKSNPVISNTYAVISQGTWCLSDWLKCVLQNSMTIKNPPLQSPTYIISCSPPIKVGMIDSVCKRSEIREARYFPRSQRGKWKQDLKATILWTSHACHPTSQHLPPVYKAASHPEPHGRLVLYCEVGCDSTHLWTSYLKYTEFIKVCIWNFEMSWQKVL